MRQPINTKTMQKIACITLVMNEIGQKIASKGELVHRVYLRHLIQEMNLCCRLFAKKTLCKGYGANPSDYEER